LDIINIPDTHITPGISNDKCEMLGEFIMERRPEIIVHDGDFGDVHSCSSWDKGKLSGGLSFEEDCAWTRDAMRRLLLPIRRYNDSRASNKKRTYKPKLIMLEGNHENRITRWVNDNPSLNLPWSVDDLGYKEDGWTVYPFLEKVQIEGITFCHYFPSGNMGAAISGTNPARSILTKFHSSCVSAHSHLKDTANDVDATGRRINCLVAGCFMDHTPGYAVGTADKWWRGVQVLHGVKDGNWDLEEISMERLRYG